MCYLHSRPNIVSSRRCPSSVRPSFHPSIKAIFSETITWINAEFWGKTTCPPYLQIISVVVCQNFKFFIFFCNFFFFSLTWDHMWVKSSNKISSESTHQMHSPKIMHTPGEGGGVSTKLFKNLWNFKFWIFAFFFFFLLTWDHMGVEVSNDISGESIHQICSPNFM